jgi:hypothetical protein
MKRNFISHYFFACDGYYDVESYSVEEARCERHEVTGE